MENFGRGFSPTGSLTLIAEARPTSNKTINLIFNYKNDSYAPNEFTNMETKFLVGAPFHFYFGIVKGASAMDRFVKKYVRQE